jgi:prevent-host-death family protein
MLRKNISNTFNLHNSWPLQDAKARLSELVRKAQESGPQCVTVHGRNAVIILSINEFELLQPSLTGLDLISTLQASPATEIKFERLSVLSPVRDVNL